MQLTYDQLRRFTTENDASPDQTKDIPLSGLVSGSLIGLGLWGMIAVVIWSVFA